MTFTGNVLYSAPQMTNFIYVTGILFLPVVHIKKNILYLPIVAASSGSKVSSVNLRSRLLKRGGIVKILAINKGQ